MIVVDEIVDVWDESPRSESRVSWDIVVGIGPVRLFPHIHRPDMTSAVIYLQRDTDSISRSWRRWKGRWCRSDGYYTSIKYLQTYTSTDPPVWPPKSGFSTEISQKSPWNFGHHTRSIEFKVRLHLAGRLPVKRLFDKCKAYKGIDVMSCGTVPSICRLVTFSVIYNDDSPRCSWVTDNAGWSD